ncbi:AraC family transcriptional regulator [Paenibacillus sp. 1P07SE]|uniref:AraC family transcriptional regulator n=1 Tax=Paenibacillus sp. 1P07SE TaxID=3132209 RepID=UPI0039A523FE
MQPLQPLQMSKEDHGIVIVVSGGGKLERDDTVCQIGPAMAALYGPGRSLQLTCTQGQELHLWLICYRAISLQTASPERPADEQADILVVPGTEAVLPLVREMGRLKTLGRLHEPLAGTRLLYELLHRLADCRQQHEAARQTDAAERVRSHIERHYMHSIDKGRLAAVAGRSRKTLPSLFRQSFGRSISEYTNELRIRRAQELLLSPGGRLSDVAQAVGYKDEFYLSKKFKQTTGVPPSVYIKRAKSFASLDHAYTLDFIALDVAPRVAMADVWLEHRYPHLLKSNGCHTINWSWSRPARFALLEQAAPDVIVYAEQEGDDLERLRRISPVVQIPWQGVSWREHFRIVSELAGQLPRAEAWLARFDERTAAVREELSELLQPGSTIGILNIRAGHLILYRAGYMGADLIYRTLGLTPPVWPGRPEEEAGEWMEVTLPLLAATDPDDLIVAIEDSPAAYALASQTMAQSLWSTLSSVRLGRAYTVDMTKWYGYGPAAIEAQLEELMGLIRRSRPGK